MALMSIVVLRSLARAGELNALEFNCRVECKGPKTARALGPGLLILWLGSLTSPAAARAGLDKAADRIWAVLDTD